MNTRRYPQQDGIRRLPQPYGPNDMGRVALLLCSAHAATPFYPAIQGIFLQEAGGQGMDATEQVNNALKGKPTVKELALIMPLVTTQNISDPKIQQTVKRVYPPSAGGY